MLYIHKTMTYVILNYDIIFSIILVTLTYIKSAFEIVFICIEFYFVC